LGEKRKQDKLGLVSYFKMHKRGIKLYSVTQSKTLMLCCRLSNQSNQINLIGLLLLLLLFFFCPWYLFPKGEEINQRDYNALGASRLVRKLGRQVPK